MKLIAGNSNRPLSEAVSAYLNVPLTQANVRRFSDMEVFVEIEENIRGEDVFVIQSTSFPANDNLMELLVMLDALRRASARRVTAVVPYYGYARQDRKTGPRTPISAKLVSNLITTAGANRLLTIDLHAGQIQGFFDVPGDALTAFHLLSDYIISKMRGGELDDLVVVTTDLGFAKQGRNWAESLGVPLAFVEKRRSGDADSPQALSLIGNVEGKNVLLVDDEVNTAGSVVRAVNVVRDYGARDVLFAFTHPFLTDKAYERLAALDLREIVFTNTLPIAPEKKLPNMTVLSIAPLLGEVILRAHEGRSVGALFNE